MLRYVSFRLLQGLVVIFLVSITSFVIMQIAPGSPVDIHIGPNGDLAVVRISDLGSGIPPVDQERIFGQFETGKLGGKNAGVGLYVSRQIAEAHGGIIRVESRPGKGATFILELPLQPSHLPAVPA